MHKKLNKKSLDFHQGFVLEAGLEPARPKRAQDFKSGVSTIPPLEHRRARDGIRTRDPDLGKVVLYQLSYFRFFCECKYREKCNFDKNFFVFFL